MALWVWNVLICSWWASCILHNVAQARNTMKKGIISFFASTNSFDLSEFSCPTIYLAHTRVASNEASFVQCVQIPWVLNSMLHNLCLINALSLFSFDLIELCSIWCCVGFIVEKRNRVGVKVIRKMVNVGGWSGGAWKCYKLHCFSLHMCIYTRARVCNLLLFWGFGCYIYWGFALSGSMLVVAHSFLDQCIWSLFWCMCFLM